MELMDNDAKVVLVTGASSGIGAATAKLFAQRGFKLAIHGTNKERVALVATECSSLSPANFEVRNFRRHLPSL